jgi:hypothetical protein
MCTRLESDPSSSCWSRLAGRIWTRLGVVVRWWWWFEAVSGVRNCSKFISNSESHDSIFVMFNGATLPCYHHHHLPHCLNDNNDNRDNRDNDDNRNVHHYGGLGKSAMTGKGPNDVSGGVWALGSFFSLFIFQSLLTNAL